MPSPPALPPGRSTTASATVGISLLPHTEHRRGPWASDRRGSRLACWVPVCVLGVSVGGLRRCAEPSHLGFASGPGCPALVCGVPSPVVSSGLLPACTPAPPRARASPAHCRCLPTSRRACQVISRWSGGHVHCGPFPSIRGLLCCHDVLWRHCDVWVCQSEAQGVSVVLGKGCSLSHADPCLALCDHRGDAEGPEYWA